MEKFTPYCKRVFDSFDEDGDGKITVSQLQKCIAMIGGELSDEEAEMVAQPLISDGLVGLEEFAGLVESESEEEKMGDLRKAFGMYKMEGEECITPRSLKRMLGRFGDWHLDECAVMINRFDVNGDGVLSFEEFRLMMLN